ncbi:MAG: exopolysaccharide biosynthesis polyprenyl glycosylphosphotransferase [Acidimicrobiales bacterium]|nr:exopolysaccharide biosynthesis polyprenyl glycosylphosphotransferase [Acidimicrobiales bacterium]
MNFSDFESQEKGSSILLKRVYLRLWQAGFRWLYLADSLVIFLVLVIIMTVRFKTEWPDKADTWIGIVVAMVLFQTVYYFGGMYEKQFRLGQRMWFSRIAGLTLIGLAISFMLLLPTGRHPLPRANLPAVGIFVALAATGTRKLSQRLRAKRFGPPRVLLVGTLEQTKLAEKHLHESDSSASVVGLIDRNQNLSETLLEDVVENDATDLVFVDNFPVDSLFPEPARAIDKKGIGIYLRVTASTALIGLREVREISGIPYVMVRARALRPHQLRLKRFFELVVVLAISPVILIATLGVSLWLKIVVGSNIILTQKRVGMDERVFTLFKFRTMRVDAEADGGAQLAESDDERVVKGCHWLRRTRFDELPQFWNVLKGDMSLVGPRPERPELVSDFAKVIPGYGRRHEIPPGITGLAQIKGRYHTDASYKLGHDLQYLMSWSLVLDLQIIARTLVVMFRRKL